MNGTDFLKRLFQFCDGKIEIRFFTTNGQAFFDTDDLTGIDAHCERHKNTNWYFGVGTRDGIRRLSTTGEPASEMVPDDEVVRGGKHNLVHIPAVWCDLDFKVTPREIASTNLTKFLFKPSIIVKTGGGVHIYWVLKEPAIKSDISLIEAVNHRIADALGGDHNATNAAAVLRVPGGRNWKKEYAPNGSAVEVVQVGDYNYTIGNFLEILPESDHEKPKNENQGQSSNEPGWLARAMQGVDKSQTPGVSRNKTGAKIAGYWVNKLQPADVLTILAAWNFNNKPPLNEQELKTIVNSVSRYGPDLSLKNKQRVDISNVYDATRMINEYREFIKSLKKNRFITGIREIDKRIRGVGGGEVLMILARAGAFKTAMLQNMLKNYCDNSSWAAVFFSIEMPIASLTERFFSMLTFQEGRDIEKMFRDPSQEEARLRAESRFTQGLNNFYSIPTRISLSDITAYVQLIEREKDIKVGVIGVDYLGLMQGPGSNVYEITSKLATGLKSTAKLLGIAIIALTQTSRKGKAGETEVSIDMARDSGQVEEGADFMLGMWKNKNGDDDETALICKILKNRKGPEGSAWKLDLVPYALHIGPDAKPYKTKKEGVKF